MTAARIAAEALATLRKFMGKRGVVDKKDGIRGLIASMKKDADSLEALVKRALHSLGASESATRPTSKPPGRQRGSLDVAGASADGCSHGGPPQVRTRRPRLLSRWSIRPNPPSSRFSPRNPPLSVSSVLRRPPRLPSPSLPFSPTHRSHRSSLPAARHDSCTNSTSGRRPSSRSPSSAKTPSTTCATSFAAGSCPP